MTSNIDGFLYVRIVYLITRVLHGRPVTNCDFAKINQPVTSPPDVSQGESFSLDVQVIDFTMFSIFSCGTEQAQTQLSLDDRSQ
jgi:hypothetical protein